MAQPSQFELSTEQYIVADHYIASSVADVQFFTAPVKCQVGRYYRQPDPRSTVNGWQLVEGVRTQEPWDRACYQHLQLRLR